MINEMLDNQILKEQEVKRERSGLFSPSSLGRCFRYQIWNRMDEEKSNPIPLNVLRTFRAGNIYHRDLQSLLPEDAVEVEFTIEDIHGFADWVGDDFVADFKTINQFGWKYINKEGFDIGEDKLPNVLQVMTECYLLKKNLGLLIFVNKDTYAIKEFTLLLGDWVEKIEDELATLRIWWAKHMDAPDKFNIPPPIPRCYNGKECNYCCFKDKCKEIGG